MLLSLENIDSFFSFSSSSCSECHYPGRKILLGATRDLLEWPSTQELGTLVGAMVSNFYRAADKPKYILEHALEICFVPAGLIAVLVLRSNYARINARRNREGNEKGHSMKEMSELGDEAPTFMYMLWFFVCSWCIQYKLWKDVVITDNPEIKYSLDILPPIVNILVPQNFSDFPVAQRRLVFTHLPCDLCVRTLLRQEFLGRHTLDSNRIISGIKHLEP